jgi:hypothetical protein
LTIISQRRFMLPTSEALRKQILQQQCQRDLRGVCGSGGRSRADNRSQRRRNVRGECLTAMTRYPGLDDAGSQFQLRPGQSVTVTNPSTRSAFLANVAE